MMDLGIKLFPWQHSALENWRIAKGRGIVEAVTGTGKTVVGLAAIVEMAKRHGFRSLHPLVVVPTQVLQAQWVERLSTHLPAARVGLIGQGHASRYASCDICVGIINSVIRQLEPLFSHTRRSPGTFRTLLIADECHHYIHAPVFNRLLKQSFDYTMGLSATIRPAVFDNHVPGLGRVVYSYEFENALLDGLIPPFDIVNCACSFTTREHEQYFDLDARVKDQFLKVQYLYDNELRNVPPELFWNRLKQLMAQPDGSECPIIKSLFLLLFRRAALSYQAAQKMALAASLTLQMISQGKKVMVFLERINDADQVTLDASDLLADRLVTRVKQSGIAQCSVYHSQLTRQERHQTLEAFKLPGAKALVSCRTLDEGLDVGDVDCAILVASTQSPRQRIQRIGRILRRFEGKKRALVVTFFIPGTGDGNVVADDRELFGRHVTITQANPGTITSIIRKLLDPTRLIHE